MIEFDIGTELCSAVDIGTNSGQGGAESIDLCRALWVLWSL
jgi:hypothetical protein